MCYVQSPDLRADTGTDLRKVSVPPACLVGNSSISNLFLWAKPRVHAYPVKMQITLESKIPNLQVLLQFNSSNTGNLINQASPSEADTSLGSSDMQSGEKPGNGGQAFQVLSVTTWEMWGEGQRQQQRIPARRQRLSNPDPFHCPEPAPHRTSILSLIRKSTTAPFLHSFHSFPKLLFEPSSLYYEFAALDICVHFLKV